MPTSLADVWGILLVGIPVAILVGLIAAKRDPGDLFCTTCGATGSPKRSVQGTFAAELILWIVGIALAVLLLWPAIIVPIAYSLYRLFSSRSRACRSCGAETLVPLNSPVAQKMRRELGKP